MADIKSIAESLINNTEEVQNLVKVLKEEYGITVENKERLKIYNFKMNNLNK